MQPWKISVGLTAILCAGGLLLAGEGFSWISPYFWTVLTGYWLADTGRKVDLMERSIRRGEGGQSDLAEKLEQEERGEYPGA